MTSEGRKQWEPSVKRALAAARRGEAVLVAGDLEDDALDGCHLHLVLAAERATPGEVDRMLRLGNGSTVLAIARDRLECLAAAGNGGQGSRRVREGEAWPEGPRARELAAAAARLAGNGAGLTRAAIDGLEVHCAAWGGVVDTPGPVEAAVDLARLAGLAPMALVSRLDLRGARSVDRDGEAAPCARVAIGDLVRFRRSRDSGGLRQRGPQVRLPTRHGEFALQAYEDPLTGQLHLALWQGVLQDGILVRVHSECLTGDLLGSLRCDCGAQLSQALAAIAAERAGVLIYLRQEGRGIGLVNKLRAYAIQDEGFDTIDANRRLGFAPDQRDYEFAAVILKRLGISSVRLLTNNPRKCADLELHGVRVVTRVPLVAAGSAENQGYLDAKRTKMGHWLPDCQ